MGKNNQKQSQKTSEKLEKSNLVWYKCQKANLPKICIAIINV